MVRIEVKITGPGFEEYSTKSIFITNEQLELIKEGDPDTTVEVSDVLISQLIDLTI